MAEERLAAATADIGQAKALLFPRIALTGSFGFTSTELDTLFDGPSKAWNIIGNLLQPVFNAGAYEPDPAIWNSIQTDVHFGILDGLPVFLDPYNSRARRRERKRKQAAAAVQVENTFCAGDAPHRATLQHGRGADVRLEKRIR